MGLTIYSSDLKQVLFLGTYSSFKEFRINIAEQEGLLKYKNGMYGQVWKGNYEEMVDEIKEECPLLTSFLTHSDCNGELTLQECIDIYNHFLSLAYTSDSFLKFKNGLRYCIDNKMGATFCG